MPPWAVATEIFNEWFFAAADRLISQLWLSFVTSVQAIFQWMAISMRSLLLLFLGIPIPFIILIALFVH